MSVRLFAQVQVSEDANHLIIPIATAHGYECEVLTQEGDFVVLDEGTYPTVEGAISAQQIALSRYLQEWNLPIAA